ncbi:hypothetical protein [Streptomyces sp. NPDC101776]|uniref:hypothetical protein n=1 Tax=Streptomyces sp. NPDC101776 TaxID=3366146 RepID=UPI003810643B
MEVDPESLRGKEAIDRNSEEIGWVDRVIASEDGNAQWVFIRTNDEHENAVPAEKALVRQGLVEVALDKDIVTHSPAVEATGDLTHAEEVRLGQYYGMSMDGESFQTPLDVANAYAEGLIDREDTAKRLARWPYRPHVRDDSGILDDPPVWNKGTIHDLEIALTLGLIDMDIYGHVLELMSISGTSRDGATHDRSHRC